MSSPNNKIYTSSKIIDFYVDKIKNFGNSPQGVGWKDDTAQMVRFAQLLKVIQDKNNFSINDLGCGSGRLYKYLQSENYNPSVYHGYDLLVEMLQSAELSLQPDTRVDLVKIESPRDMILSDYTVASGIFNVKYEVGEQEWLNHILLTTESMNEKSRFGFAFNLLTSYSDDEHKQSYLYYANPLFLFDYCKKNFSKNVALLHDYDQYDFTIIVRKN